MSEPAGMEPGSVDGDSALCSRQAWRLAAWMVISQPANDSKLILYGFHGFGSVLGGEGFPACGGGLDGGRGPKETLQSWNLHSDD